MTSPTRSSRLRRALALVRCAAWLVPASRRAEWSREWEAELRARSAAGGDVSGPAMGAFEHGIWLRWEGWTMTGERLVRDLRIACRGLLRRPVFAVTATLTLAVGMGATTAVYSVVDGVLMAPLPYPGADRLVRVTADFRPWDMKGVDLTPALLSEWRSHGGALEAMEGYMVREANLVGAGTPVVVRQARITAGLLTDVLGQRALVGRLLSSEENAEGRNGVAVISEGVWAERFGRDPGVLGSRVELDDRVVEIVGVVPDVALIPGVDVWTPHPFEVDHARVLFGGFHTIARRAPGVSIEAAQSALDRAAARVAEAHPRTTGAFVPQVVDLRDTLVADAERHLWMLLIAVFAVLMIACLNVAQLLLARGVDREAELALRRSLGAAPRHLLTEAWSEAVVVAALGAAGGLLVARGGIAALASAIPTGLAGPTERARALAEAIPLAPTVELDVRVLLFAMALTVGVGLLVGLLPALRALRASELRPDSRGSATRPRRRAARLLLGVEVTQAAALLVFAALMVHSLARMGASDSGVEPRELLFVHLDLPDYRYGPDADPLARAGFVAELRSRLEALPAVRAVGVGTATPFSGMTFMTGVELEGGLREGSGDGGLDVLNPWDDAEPLAWMSRMHVDEAYLSALGLPVVAGRTLAAADRASGAPVALVNELAASAYWPGEDPVGARLREGGDEERPWVTIAGVVGDFAHPGVASYGLAELYLPLTEEVLADARRPKLLVRFSGPERAVIDEVQRTIWALDPALPIPAISTAEEALGAGMAVNRFYTLALVVFAAVAVALASLGIYGVMSHSVARRTREVGIRLALGAPVRAVAALIVREGMAVVGVGLAVGLSVAAAAAGLLDGLLYGVSGTDAATYVAVALMVAGVALVAMWVPARRAMRADPVGSLRAE